MDISGWGETRWKVGVFFKQNRFSINICVANILAPTVLEEKATDTFGKRVVAFVIAWVASKFLYIFLFNKVIFKHCQTISKIPSTKSHTKILSREGVDICG